MKKSVELKKELETLRNEITALKDSGKIEEAHAKLNSLKDLENRLKSKWFALKYDTKVINFILKNVYNPDFWAREVRRYLVDYIEELIAEEIITNKNTKEFALSIVKEKIVINNKKTEAKTTKKTN